MQKIKLKKNDGVTIKLVGSNEESRKQLITALIFSRVILSVIIKVIQIFNIFNKSYQWYHGERFD